MEEVLVLRLIEAAEKAAGNPGFLIEVRQYGIRIKYTWSDVEGTNHYTLENFTGWKAISRAAVNPLLFAMDSLARQAEELKA